MDKKISNKKTFLIPFISVILIPVFVLAGVYIFDKVFFNDMFTKGKDFVTIRVLKRNNQKEEVLEDNSVFSENIQPIFSEPKILIIPSIDLRAEVEVVGVEESGAMQVPSGWSSVGWLKKSANPSEKDIMILNGHYDDSYGSPAVFYRLKNISVGDKVSVIDDNNKYFTYVVVDSFFIDIKDPSRAEVFTNFNEGTSTLVLITCGGVWNSVEQTYDKRLVVRAEYYLD